MTLDQFIWRVRKMRFLYLLLFFGPFRGARVWMGEWDEKFKERYKLPSGGW